MVSGTMEITRATLMAGTAAINTQRGTDAWGANWVFNPSGAQNDVLVIADAFQKLSTSGAYATDAEVDAVSGTLNTKLNNVSGVLNTKIANASGTIVGSGQAFQFPTIVSGTFNGNLYVTPSGSVVIGTSGAPLNSGFLYASDFAGAVYRIVVLPGGFVSGVAAY